MIASSSACFSARGAGSPVATTLSPSKRTLHSCFLSGFKDIQRSRSLTKAFSRRPNSPVSNLFESFGMKAPSWFPRFGSPMNVSAQASDPSNPALDLDSENPGPGLQFASFGAGCFWGVELALQRVPGVVRTEVGYMNGKKHNPTYDEVCTGYTMHVEAVRVAFDPKNVAYEELLSVFWQRHDPTQLNGQGNDWGTQYRSGIYFYSPEQEKIAKESMEAEQARLGRRKIVTEIVPARRFYRAEEYHQQYLEKGGRFGRGQSAAKGCNDPIRCYG